MLEALQRLKAISLHADARMGGSDDQFVAASARLACAIDTLDEIEAQAGSALIFLDDLDMQARLAGLLQRRYKLSKAPTARLMVSPGRRGSINYNRAQGSPS